MCASRALLGAFALFGAALGLLAPDATETPKQHLGNSQMEAALKLKISGIPMANSEVAEMASLSDEEAEARIFEASRMYHDQIANRLAHKGGPSQKELTEKEMHSLAKKKAHEAEVVRLAEEKTAAIERAELQKAKREAESERKQLHARKESQERERFIKAAKEAEIWKEEARKNAKMIKADEEAAPKPKMTKTTKNEKGDGSMDMQNLLGGTTGGTRLTFETESAAEAEAARKVLEEAEKRSRDAARNRDEEEPPHIIQDSPLAGIPRVPWMQSAEARKEAARKILENQGLSDNVLTSEDMSAIATSGPSLQSLSIPKHHQTKRHASGGSWVAKGLASLASEARAAKATPWHPLKSMHTMATNHILNGRSTVNLAGTENPDSEVLREDQGVAAIGTLLAKSPDITDLSIVSPRT